MGHVVVPVVKRVQALARYRITVGRRIGSAALAAPES